MDFVIDRKIWLRGEGSERSALLRAEDGKMCCLGIFLDKCGVPRGRLKGAANPMDPFRPQQDLNDVPKPAQCLFDKGSLRSQVFNLMGINDAVGEVSEGVREERIAQEFADIGVRVTFVDGPSESESGSTDE